MYNEWYFYYFTSLENKNELMNSKLILFPLASTCITSILATIIESPTATVSVSQNNDGDRKNETETHFLNNLWIIIIIATIILHVFADYTWLFAFIIIMVGIQIGNGIFASINDTADSNESVVEFSSVVHVAVESEFKIGSLGLTWCNLQLFNHGGPVHSKQIIYIFLTTLLIYFNKK